MHPFVVHSNLDSEAITELLPLLLDILVLIEWLACYLDLDAGHDLDHALWEDCELGGFAPLLPAQTILNFSRKHSHARDGEKEKKVQVKRIIAAGKSLTEVVRVDQRIMCFNSKPERFIPGAVGEDFTKYSKQCELEEWKKNTETQLQQVKKYAEVVWVLPHTKVRKRKGMEQKEAPFMEVQVDKGGCCTKWIMHADLSRNLSLFFNPSP